ncbi:malto-oligosyltrehalose trehalohydrolase [Salinimicrobium flavum]|uniref:Malto-oligosyltrehalose trehalohydrolase n=1 Tax=Salinimicrobium flavum TaxID=1737065 RepID=A0ABW5J1E6_9FLAO
MGKKVGAEYLGERKYRFRVWSPFAEKVQVILKDSRKVVDMKKDERGYWEAEVNNLSQGTFYKIRLDEEEEYPDPASRSQPEGVHSWSEIPNSSYTFEASGWKGRAIDEMVIYELHVGTFTPQGTFTAIINKLNHLAELGVNTLELMPVSQFPGDRNWGYDGVYPYAPQGSYGGEQGLKELIDTCHQRGFSVLLDVVYNHLGPEGNYLSQFGPYFTDKYHTPWGSALNFDDEYADEVRNFFIQNALMWLEEYRFDGLRLDAVHEIIDRGAKHFLKELSQEVDALEQKTGCRYMLIAESDLNDTRLIRAYRNGGYGLEGQWVDDFHHSLHTILTGEGAGYYKDFGKMEYLAKTFRQAFVYDGIYSTFRKRSVGNSPLCLPKTQFVVSIQNHDQVGNRLLGERLSKLVSFEKQKLAVGMLFTAPYVPMLFMGEEFGETRPFQYFVSHGDKDLVKAVQEGRKKEFEYFHHGKEGGHTDPQAEETFKSSKIDWDYKKDTSKITLFEFYRELLRLRKEGAFRLFASSQVKTEFNEEKKWLRITSEEEGGSLFGLFNFGDEVTSWNPSETSQVEILFASADKKWGGPGTFENLWNPDDGIPAGSFVIFKF